MAFPGHIKAVPQAISNKLKQDIFLRIGSVFLFRRQQVESVVIHYGIDHSAAHSCISMCDRCPVFVYHSADAEFAQWAGQRIKQLVPQKIERDNRQVAVPFIGKGESSSSCVKVRYAATRSAAKANLKFRFMSLPARVSDFPSRWCPNVKCIAVLGFN